MGLDLREWDVLLVEDILDTGRTLCELKRSLRQWVRQVLR